MTFYSAVVFVHVVSAIVLVGSTFFAPFIGAGLRRTTTVEGVREWATVFRRIGQFAGKAAPVTLLAGIYLAFDGGWWGSGWLEVSLALFLLSGVGAMGVLDPAAARLIEAAEAAPDGPVPAELEAQRHDRRMATVEAFLLPGDVAIVFLMTNKPGFLGALTTAVVAALAGVVLLRMQAATHRRVAPA